MSLGIRDARIDDAEAIARIHVDAWRAAYAGMLPARLLGSLDVAERARRQRQRLASPLPRAATLVAEDGGGLRGWIQAGPTRDDDDDRTRVAEVYAIYLAPDAWRRGIGSTLMHRALEHAARIGAGEATVWVLDQNARARRFYEARGFRCDDARKLIDLGGATLSEIRYRRSLLLERGRAMPPGARR